MQKQNTTLMVVTVIFMLFLIVSAAYAYFATNLAPINNVSVNTEVPSARATFTSYSTNPLQLNVTLDKLVVASTIATVTDTGDLIVKLSSPSAGQQMVCTYDVRYVWDSTNQYTTPSMTFTAKYPYEISLAATVSATGDSFSSYDYTSKNLVERDLSTFSWTGTAGTAGRYTTVISGAKIYSNTTAGTTATWNFNMRFYTLPASQASLMNKKLLGHIVTANIQC